MKKTALSALATVALILTTTSCGKHSWQETQVLHENMHKGHGEAHTEAKHDEHGKAETHAAPEAHAPVKKEEAKH
jgi:hypothetical protein